MPEITISEEMVTQIQGLAALLTAEPAEITVEPEAPDEEPATDPKPEPKPEPAPVNKEKTVTAKVRPVTENKTVVAPSERPLSEAFAAMNPVDRKANLDKMLEHLAETEKDGFAFMIKRGQAGQVTPH